MNLDDASILNTRDGDEPLTSAHTSAPVAATVKVIANVVIAGQPIAEPGTI